MEIRNSYLKKENEVFFTLKMFHDVSDRCEMTSTL
jgi:hypothetical protein